MSFPAESDTVACNPSDIVKLMMVEPAQSFFLCSLTAFGDKENPVPEPFRREFL